MKTTEHFLYSRKVCSSLLFREEGLKMVRGKVAPGNISHWCFSHVVGCSPAGIAAMCLWLSLLYNRFPILAQARCPDPLWQQPCPKKTIGAPVQLAPVTLSFPTNGKPSHRTGKWGRVVPRCRSSAMWHVHRTDGVMNSWCIGDIFQEAILVYVLLPTTQIFFDMTTIFANMPRNRVGCFWGFF